MIKQRFENYIVNFAGAVSDNFLKQTSQGWDHTVHVVIARDPCKGDVLLQWGRTKDRHNRSVPLDTVREVQVKKINGKTTGQLSISRSCGDYFLQVQITRSAN